MATATITLPILSTSASTRIWFHMLERGSFTTRGFTVYLFFAFLALSVVAAAAVVLAQRTRATRRDVALAVFAVGGWFALRTAGPVLLRHDVVAHQNWGAITLVVLLVALGAVGTFLARGHKLALLAGIPLIAVALPSLDHTGIVVALAAGAVALGSVLPRSHAIAL